MKYLILMLIVSCSDTKPIIGNCYKPYVYNGNTIKIISCIKSKSMWDSSYCVVKVKSGLNLEYLSTVRLEIIKNSIKVSCDEFSN